MVFEFTPKPEQYAWTFGGADPVGRVAPGSVMRLWSEDAFCGALSKTTDLATGNLMGDLNPQTGPFYVEGAQPGDTLVVHVADLQPARSWGASTAVPFFGALTGTDLTATLQPALPERTWIYEVDESTSTVQFQAQGSPHSLSLPLEPMLGTLGVAPAQREVRTSLVPGPFGGNMDTPELRAGSTMYLRVNVDGALFSIGDGHYRQGEGESCGTAVEGAMHTTLIVDVLHGSGPEWPRIEDDNFLTVIGSTRPLEDAWRISQVQMVKWLGEIYGLDQLDAYQLAGQISQSPIANVVDPNYSAATKLPKRLLPSGQAYDGIHAALRARALTI